MLRLKGFILPVRLVSGKKWLINLVEEQDKRNLVIEPPCPAKPVSLNTRLETRPRPRWAKDAEKDTSKRLVQAKQIA